MKVYGFMKHGKYNNTPEKELSEIFALQQMEAFYPRTVCRYRQMTQWHRKSVKLDPRTNQNLFHFSAITVDFGKRRKFLSATGQ